MKVIANDSAATEGVYVGWNKLRKRIEMWYPVSDI